MWIRYDGGLAKFPPLVSLSCNASKNSPWKGQYLPDHRTYLGLLVRNPGEHPEVYRKKRLGVIWWAGICKDCELSHTRNTHLFKRPFIRVMSCIYNGPCGPFFERVVLFPNTILGRLDDKLTFDLCFRSFTLMVFFFQEIWCFFPILLIQWNSSTILQVGWN